jgi:hypothetical protein
MKKFIIPVLFVFVVCMLPMTASAKTICWTDGFSFFVLSGGKPNSKPFAGKYVSPFNGCHGVLTGSIVVTGPNISTVSIEGNLPAPCVNFALYGTTSDPAFNFTGVFDNLENGTADGNSTMTIVSCASVPTNPLNVPESKLPSKATAGYNPPKN